MASAGAGGIFHLEVNGADVTGPLGAPNTGGWQSWTTLRKTGVTLTAGLQTWRLVMDANGSTGAVANFNYIRATHRRRQHSVWRDACRAARNHSSRKLRRGRGRRRLRRQHDDRTPEDSIVQPASTSSRRATAAAVTTSVGRSAGEWLNYSVTVGDSGNLRRRRPRRVWWRGRHVPYRGERRRQDRAA